MELFKLSCPRCNAELDNLDDLDLFYCPYCGQKIVLDDKSRRNSKVRLKGYERDENIARIQADVDKTESYQKTNRIKIKTIGEHAEFFGLIGLVVICFLFSFVFAFSDSRKESKEEKRVSAIYDEARELLYDGEYEDALARANFVIYDSSVNRSKSEEWDKRRKKLIKSIEEAMGIPHEEITLQHKASYYRGKNYKDVELAFETLGFIDVTLEPVSDTSLGDLFIGDDEVLGVSINGTSDFSEGDKFQDDAIVIIRYK